VKIRLNFIHSISINSWIHMTNLIPRMPKKEMESKIEDLLRDTYNV
jgi:hypothetical protein